MHRLAAIIPEGGTEGILGEYILPLKVLECQLLEMHVQLDAKYAHTQSIKAGKLHLCLPTPSCRPSIPLCHIYISAAVEVLMSS
jgi:hypothetical protein